MAARERAGVLAIDAALEGNREQNLFAVAVQRRHNLGEVHRLNRRSPRLHQKHIRTCATGGEPAAEYSILGFEGVESIVADKAADVVVANGIDRTRSAHGLCGELGDDAAHANLLRSLPLGQAGPWPPALGMTASRRLVTQSSSYPGVPG